MERCGLIDEAIEARRAFFSTLHASAVPVWIQLDLSMAQVKALFLLDSLGPTTIGKVACRLEIGQPAASLLVERLVLGGFAERRDDPDDRRRTFVHLTDRGEDLVEQLRHGADEYFRSLLDRLDDEDLSSLVRGLAALARLAPKRGDGRSSDNLVSEARVAESGLGSAEG
jgi:DNA-binding MarR family transcriptional regulator